MTQPLRKPRAIRESPLRGRDDASILNFEFRIPNFEFNRVLFCLYTARSICRPAPGGRRGRRVRSNMIISIIAALVSLVIMFIGLLAFVFDTAGGVLFAKFLNLFTKKKINPMIGAAGISAFPMASRIVQRMAKEEDPYNFILMPAVSANVSGQIGSVIAGGVVLSIAPVIANML